MPARGIPNRTGPYHNHCPPEAKVFSLLAIIFVSLLAGLTCSVHFVILIMSRQSAFAGLSWMPLFLSFTWPSVPYALDILAWDVFFAFSVLFAALVFSGLATLAWVLSAAIAIMVALDAAVDFCALCFVVVRLDRLGLKLS